MKTLRHLLVQLFHALQSHERVFTLVAAFFIGILTGYAGLAFQRLIQAFHDLSGWLPVAAEWLTPWQWPGIVVAPMLGGLIVGPLIWRFAPEAKGHGVPEVMAAVITKGGFIRPRVVLVKSLASAITIGSGGSVGREGPIVQIGATIGSTLGYLLHLPPRTMRTFVACGAAGGIAATFNAPIAGALFAVEIILGDFGFIQLGPIITSAVTATVVSRAVVGNFSAFEVPDYHLVNPFELIPYIGLGLLCGVVAVIFIRLLDKMEWLFERKIRIHDALKPALGGLAIGLIGLQFPEIFGVGYEAVNAALHGNIALELMALLVLVKLVATTITLASGGSGGIFAPSLFLGAMTGGTVGKAVNTFFPAWSAASGAYALVGMAAMVGATTQAPITAIVIIFELTNDYKIILPLMISTIVAVLTASTLWRDSIYTHKLRRKGIDMESGPDANVLKKVRVRDVMRAEFDRVPRDLPFNFLLDQLLQSARSHLPVVRPDGTILGVISRTIAQKFLKHRSLLRDVVIAGDVQITDFPVLLPGDNLNQAMLRFNESGLREMYVLQDLSSRKLVGMVRKGDLMDAYYREIVKQSSGESFAYSINHPHRLEPVKVMDGYGIIELESPHFFAGKLLRELDLRNKYGVNVLAIKRQVTDGGESNTKVWLPESSDRLEDGDVLVLMGRTEKLENLDTNW
ncbi:MAG: chloride channel protein [SAR324 cluster bacterium]|nr:chloride channel protein [SAR324 cluster bacterium]